MYKIKFTSLQSNIFRLLCMRAGEKLNQREIAKLLGVSAAAVGKALIGMKTLVNIEKGRTNLNSVQLIRSEPKIVGLKRAENLKLIYESELADFLENRFPSATVILFGSYSRGEDTLKSDIDIAVIGAREQTVDLSTFEKALERKISLNFYASFKKIHKDLLNNILNGILLAGTVDL